MKLLSVAMVLALGAGGSAVAQPAESFRSSCADLRANLQKLGADESELVTIAIVGPLTLVKSGSGLVYLGMCDTPAPRVLCVTYSADDLKPGDQVILSGGLSRRGPDFVLLDPCLHHREGTPP